jgi:hypothetical protein
MNAPASPFSGADQLLKEAEAAARLGICARSLRTIRQRGEIDFVLIGGAIRYSLADLARFIDERRTRCDSTKEQAAPTGGSISAGAVIAFDAVRARARAAKRK